MELGTRDHSLSGLKDMQGTKTRIPPIRPRPGRRRPSTSSLSFISTHLFIFSVLILSLLCTRVEAQQYGHLHESNGHLFARQADILYDAGPIPAPALNRRAQATSPTDISAPSTTTDSDVATSIVSEPTGTNAPLPVPFDGGLGTNYTQPSCPTFIMAMINNSTFTSCLPFSLLLQNSQSFFSTTRTLPTITHVLNAACSINAPSCSSLISNYALQLRSSSACAQDYDRQNPFVRQAYAGLIAYDILYQASCLKNVPVSNTPTPNDNNYCYANAVTNISSPSDNYPYFLPLGIPLPAAALPSCNGCLKNTMALFATAAANKSQPLSLDYVNAATMINQDCGPEFVNGTIPTVGSSGSAVASSGAVRVGAGGWVGMGVLVGAMWFFALG